MYNGYCMKFNNEEIRQLFCNKFSDEIRSQIIYIAEDGSEADLEWDKRNALLPCQFTGQGNLNFSCKLGVFRFLDFLHRVPQNRPVRESGEGVAGE